MLGSERGQNTLLFYCQLANRQLYEVQLNIVSIILDRAVMSEFMALIKHVLPMCLLLSAICWSLFFPELIKYLQLLMKISKAHFCINTPLCMWPNSCATKLFMINYPKHRQSIWLLLTSHSWADTPVHSCGCLTCERSFPPQIHGRIFPPGGYLKID